MSLSAAKAELETLKVRITAAAVRNIGGSFGISRRDRRRMPRRRAMFVPDHLHPGKLWSPCILRCFSVGDARWALGVRTVCAHPGAQGWLADRRRYRADGQCAPADTGARWDLRCRSGMCEA